VSEPETTSMPQHCTWLRDDDGELIDCEGILRDPYWTKCPSCQRPTLIEEQP
jgi:hypothetical protein